MSVLVTINLWDNKEDFEACQMPSVEGTGQTEQEALVKLAGHGGSQVAVIVGYKMGSGVTHGDLPTGGYWQAEREDVAE